MRRAKIVCTIGPASRSEEMLRRIIEAGMNVARINFSHGEKEEHRAVLETIRRIDPRVTILQDLAGPKIRIGEMAGGQATLRVGEIFTLTTREVTGDEHIAHVTYSRLAGDVSPGDNVFLSDGIIHLVVEKVEGKDVSCRVVHGGVLTSRKGVNLPGVRISAPALTDKDIDDLEFGVELGVDYVALSFIRNAQEVEDVKRRLTKRKVPVKVVAKIEKREAIEDLDGILKAADALMIARGDLGVEIPTEEVPVVQKRIIGRCRELGKPVITATQMLESMISSERPTRAEASDVANAVLDGTDAVMLSAESATGQFPVESVAMMDRIIRMAEEHHPGPPCGHGGGPPAPAGSVRDGLADAVCAGAVKVAEEIGALAIAALTHSGETARLLAKHRPRVPIVALTNNPPVIRQMGLVWGVQAIAVERIEATDTIFAIVREKVKAAGFSGKVVLVAGIPTCERGSTNTVHVISM